MAVLGAGASGLVSLHVLVQNGLDPVCFEQQDFVGGMWKYSEDPNLATVYKSTVINTSKAIVCFIQLQCLPEDQSEASWSKRESFSVMCLNMSSATRP